MINSMENKDTRRANFLKLVSDFKTLKAFSEAADLDESYASQLKNGHREIGDRTARKIEGALKLPAGWLDATQAVVINETAESRPNYVTHHTDGDVVNLENTGVPAEIIIRIMIIISKGIGMEKFESYPDEEQKRLVQMLQTATLDEESKDLSNQFILKMVGAK